MIAPRLKTVSIRMYRGILGDCFLLRTTVEFNGSKSVKSILIDCGVLQNVVSGSEMLKKLDPAVIAAVGQDKLAAIVDGPTRIRQVAEDVLATVGNRIDLLIITHEHFDHLSGFGFSRRRFLDKAVVIDRLWMAWTEDFSDRQANSLRTRLAKGKQALAAAASLADSMGVDAPQALSRAAALAAFAGTPMQPSDPGAAERFGTYDIMQMLKDKVGPAGTDYLEPGEVVDLNEFGLKAYILGPPRNEELLRKDLPSRGAAREVYLTRTDVAAAAESTATTRLALGKIATAEPTEFAEVTPFGAIHLSPLRDGRRISTPSKARERLESLYNDADAAWRRIDDSWTDSIEDLALKMDSDTNNTSLVIAFELPDGQILLFPGDAQVGNWLSWHDQDYPKKCPEGSNVKSTTIEDILQRTTFYKGSHHLSHNATLKELGLERMSDPRLVVAAPVVEALAAVQGKGRTAPMMGWKMPYPDLYSALNKNAQGRIVRGDSDPEDEQRAFHDRPTDTNRPVTITHAKDGLWVELTFKLA